MLEALIRITDPPTDSKIKAKGDIVVVKLAGAVWGTLETKQFLRVQHEDAALEAQLLEMQAAGEPTPVISLPYAEYEINLLTQQEELVVCSSKKLDIEKLEKPIKDSLVDLKKDKPIVEKAKAKIKDKTTDEKPVKIAKA